MNADVAHMVFGGDWGGKLQGKSADVYDKDALRPTSGPGLKPRLAKMANAMRSFDGGVVEMSIGDANGKDLQAHD